MTPLMMAATEQIEEGFAKASVHKTIRNWIAAGRGICQQLAETNGGVAKCVVDEFRIEERHGVYYVEGSPADEEFENDYEQHFDDTLLVLEIFLDVRSETINGLNFNYNNKT